MTDFFQAEHLVQSQRNNAVRARASSASSMGPRSQSTPAFVPHDSNNNSNNSSNSSVEDPEQVIDDSLSRLKLRNAVDLANSLLDYKQEKRMIQVHAICWASGNMRGRLTYN